MSKVFAANLKTYRQLAKMTQADLAKAVGITRDAVNNYERGQSEPSFENLCKFADALGVEITNLVEDRTTYPDYIRRVQVTDEESALLQAYREASVAYQAVALKLLRDNKEER